MITPRRTSRAPIVAAKITPVLRPLRSSQARKRATASLVQSGAKGIVVFPISPTALNQVVKNACNKGVIVYAYDAEITEPCAYNIHIDQTEAGRVTAEWLAKAMGGKGNVLVLEGPETIPTAAARLRGFKDALKEFPDVKVVLSKNAMYARPAAADLLKAMLKVNPPPQVDGILAANDAMAFGAIEAFKEAKKKPPLIVGINASKEAVEFIKAGEMLASGDYNGLIEGCLGAEIAIRTLRKQPVPKEVLAKTAVVDKSNYQAYEFPVERRPCPTLESMAAK